MDAWIPVTSKLPPDGEAVVTKIDDDRGVRNEQRLVRRGRLWFFPDETMYVYYTPTHWRPPGARPVSDHDALVRAVLDHPDDDTPECGLRVRLREMTKREYEEVCDG